MRTPIIQALCVLFITCALACGAPAGAQDMPPLVWAVNQGDTEKVRTLLAAGEPLHLEDGKGLSALDHALAYSPSRFAPDLACLLAQHGAPPGSGEDGRELALARHIVGRTPLVQMQAFLADGFDASGLLPNGFTPFLWVAACGVVPEYIDLLVEYGVALDQSLPPDELTGNQAGDNALLLALCSNPELEAAQALLDAGADVQVSNGVSYTAFFCAARREGASELLRLLAKQGADPADVADGGGTAMHEAAMHNPDIAVIRTLLELGTPISGMSAENESFLGTDSVFKLALEHNPNPEVIRLLLEKGVDTSRRDANGKLAWESLSAKRKVWLARNGLDLSSASAAASTQNAKKATPQITGDGRLALRDVSRETDLARLPEVKGKLVKALRYQDASGENLILLTRTEEMFRRVGEERYLGGSREIFAYRFLMQGSSAEQQWRVRDYVLDCRYEVEIEFILKGLQVSDLDKNGLAEVWLPYRLACRAEQAPGTMKIIMYEGGQKYAVRGQTKVQYPNSAYAGGDYVMDKALTEAPPRFREFAAELWAKLVHE